MSKPRFGIIHVHHSTLEEGRAVFVLRHGHSTSSKVLHEVDRLAHVSVDVIELQAEHRSVVEVGVVTGSQHFQRLAGPPPFSIWLRPSNCSLVL